MRRRCLQLPALGYLEGSCGQPFGFRGEDRAADQLGDLGDYGVSEGSEAVHPIGNPISHSTHVGFSCPLCSDTTMDSMACLPFARRRWIAGLERFPRSRLSDADGVGQNFAQRSSDTVLFVSKFSTSLLVDCRSIWSEAVGVGTLCVGFAVIPRR